MSNFKSTLLSYQRYLDDGLFKNMVMPDGIDKDLLIQVILKECGEMTPVWTDPIFMQDMIGVWSQKWGRTIEKWLAAYNAEYDPIANYDRHEVTNDSTNRDIETKNTGGYTDNIAHTGGYTDTETRSAYDSNTYEPHNKLQRANNNLADNETFTDTRNFRTNDDTAFAHSSHMYGNIGVTTSQQMLEAEYNIAKWNIYENIKDLFMQEFCIMIY